MIWSKPMFLWVLIDSIRCINATGGETKVKAVSSLNRPLFHPGRMLRKEELFFVDVNKRPTGKPTKKQYPNSAETATRPSSEPSLTEPLTQSTLSFDRLTDALEHDRNDELLLFEVGRRPTSDPTSESSEPSSEPPLTQSMLSFDELFDIIEKEQDRTDELLMSVITRRPTSRPTNKPTLVPIPVRRYYISHDENSLWHISSRFRVMRSVTIF